MVGLDEFKGQGFIPFLVVVVVVDPEADIRASGSFWDVLIKSFDRRMHSYFLISYRGS